MACRCRVECRRDATTRGFLGHYDLSLIGGSRDVTMKGNRCLKQDIQDFGIAKITDDGPSPVQLVQLRWLAGQVSKFPPGWDALSSS